jgi:hypothetical protein
LNKKISKKETNVKSEIEKIPAMISLTLMIHLHLLLATQRVVQLTVLLMRNGQLLTGQINNFSYSIHVHVNSDMGTIFRLIFMIFLDDDGPVPQSHFLGTFIKFSNHIPYIP